MIQNIRHKGLKLLFEHGEGSKLRADLAFKAERFLDALHAASMPEEVALPGYGLHRLTGNYQGYWSAVLCRNQRIIFRFEDGDALDVDLIDDH